MVATTEILDLLRVISEQGLYHTCAMEGYVSHQGCQECDANVEAKLAELIVRMEAQGGDQAGPGSP